MLGAAGTAGAIAAIGSLPVAAAFGLGVSFPASRVGWATVNPVARCTVPVRAAWSSTRKGSLAGVTKLRAQRRSGSGSEYSEEGPPHCFASNLTPLQVRPRASDNDDLGTGADEESIDYMKKQRQLPFDKGASEFVPTDMQPANEWQELKETFLFDWPLLETPQVTLHVDGGCVEINHLTMDSLAVYAAVRPEGGAVLRLLVPFFGACHDLAASSWRPVV
jgi:hypothetical protein